MALPKKSVDAQGRTTEQQERDEWFVHTWRKQNAKVLKPLDSSRFSFAHKQHFVEVVKKGAEGAAPVTMKIPLAPIAYDRVHVEKTLRDMATKGASVEAISEQLFQDGIKRFVALAPESSMGVKSQFAVAPNPDGVLTLNRAYEMPLKGTVMTLDKEGNASLSPLFGREEYIKYLPLLQATGSANNGWCLDMPCEEVAFLAEDTARMYDNLRAQLKNLHGVEVYNIQPRYLRYYSDGDMSSQRSGAYGIRNAQLPGGGLRPLLFDGPAWVVGIRMGSKLLPGRVFVNTEGKFICSDWCQREVDKGGGIDLHTGENTKHTLMTWCAGPGISRFGGDDKVLKESHGEVRRAKLKGGAQSLLARSHIQQGVKVLAALNRRVVNEEMSPEETFISAQTGAPSLRFSVGQPGTGFDHTRSIVAHIKNKKGQTFAAEISVAFAGGKPNLSTITAQRLYGLSIQDMWQGTTSVVKQYRIKDKDLRKAAMEALTTVVNGGVGSSNDEDDDE